MSFFFLSFFDFFAMVSPPSVLDHQLLTVKTPSRRVSKTKMNNLWPGPRPVGWGAVTRVGAGALAAVSAGGVLGALARYGLAVAWPHHGGSFPWPTFLVNVSGCLLIGALMVTVPHRPLLRPFLGVGVLGGYTTFSAYAVEALRATSPGIALAYLATTLCGAILAVWAGATAAERLRR